MIKKIVVFIDTELLLTAHRVTDENEMPKGEEWARASTSKDAVKGLLDFFNSPG